MAFDPDVGLSVFDHGHALMGTQDAQAVAHLADVTGRALLGGCLLPHLTDADELLRWTHRISQVPDDLVSDVCDTVRRLNIITTDESKAVIAMLNARKHRLWDDIRKHEGLFTGISDWGVL